MTSETTRESMASETTRESMAHGHQDPDAHVHQDPDAHGQQDIDPTLEREERGVTPALPHPRRVILQTVTKTCDPKPRSSEC